MLWATTALAHHPLEEINYEVFLTVDAMIADTPHADMVFDDMGDPTDTNLDLIITTNDLNTLENLIDDGLLDYADQLYNDVTVTIQFEDTRTVTTTISIRE
jgi:hypothetical protein